MKKKSKILVVLGPTAVGKSDLAVELALKFNGEVISADSRQVYTGLNIGAGKITKKEMKGVPHYLLDVASPKKIFTISDFQKLALEAIEEVLAKGKLPILCGGTGFYIQSIVDGISLPEVPPDEDLRNKLSKKSAPELFMMLQKLDPKRAKNIDKHNHVRLIRAIEIAKALGKVPKVKTKQLFDVLEIGLDLPGEDLREKVHKRLHKRFEQGMIAEVKRLHEKGLSWKRLEVLGLEYKWIAQFLQNKITKEEMVERLQFDTWKYAKRQRTWFKRDERIKWFTPLPKDAKKIEKEVKGFLNKFILKIP